MDFNVVTWFGIVKLMDLTLANCNFNSLLQCLKNQIIPKRKLNIADFSLKKLQLT